MYEGKALIVYDDETFEKVECPVLGDWGPVHDETIRKVSHIVTGQEKGVRQLIVDVRRKVGSLQEVTDDLHRQLFTMMELPERNGIDCDLCGGFIQLVQDADHDIGDFYTPGESLGNIDLPDIICRQCAERLFPELFTPTTAADTLFPGLDG